MAGNFASELAFACSLLLKEKEKAFPKDISGYRVTFITQENALKLKIPPIVWYDKLLDGPNAAQIAEGWIEEVKKAEISSSEANFSAREPIVMQAPEYCRRGTDCDYWKKYVVSQNGRKCDREHTWNTCIEIIQDLAGNDVRCGFFIPDELIIEKDSRFVVLVRQDDNLTRDLLVVPKPAPFFIEMNKTNNQIEARKFDKETWKGHYANEEFVQFVETWEFIKTFCAKLTKGEELGDFIEEIAFNFGNWETKISKDKYAVECHAHGHIVLSKEGHKKLSKRINHLVGRGNDPFSYDYKDATELESTRLNSAIFTAVRGDISGIKSEISGIKSEISDMKSRVSNIESEVSGIKAEVSGINAKLEDIIKILRNR